jgi:uncharacterized protein YndB with AHSA1/START domain
MSGPGSLHLERLVPGEPEDVFAAWTTPRMARWMSPEGAAEAEVDLRVGGRFRVIMVGHVDRLEHTGEYLELEPPRRLVFTWASPYTGPEPSVVTVELYPQDAGTRLVLTHEQLPAEVVDGHRNGWGEMLGRLSEVVQA